MLGRRDLQVNRLLGIAFRRGKIPTLNYLVNSRTGDRSRDGESRAAWSRVAQLSLIAARAGAFFNSHRATALTEGGHYRSGWLR